MDITMCRNKECKLAKDCLRFTATIGHMQVYLATPKEDCEEKDHILYRSK